jgi:hypothetical protein
MKTAAFGNAAPCSMRDIDIFSEELTASIIRMMMKLTDVTAVLTADPDDGGSMHLWNIDQFLSDYTVQRPRRQSSLRNKKFQEPHSVDMVPAFHTNHCYQHA